MFFFFFFNCHRYALLRRLKKKKLYIIVTLFSFTGFDVGFIVLFAERKHRCLLIEPFSFELVFFFEVKVSYLAHGAYWKNEVVMKP